METEQKSLFDRLLGSAATKLAIMFFLVILMLIPLSWIGDLINERQRRYEQVSAEISMKWGSKQVVTGPIMAIPIDEQYSRVVMNGEDGHETATNSRREWIFLLPDEIDIVANISPETLKRGIYESVVYLADIRIEGRFGALDMSKILLDKGEINWAGAKLIFGVSDLKGLSATPNLRWANETFMMVPTDQALHLFEENLVADISLADGAWLEKDFDMNLQLRGSKSINFLPLADHTHIMLSGNWPSPSFNGAFLPDERMLDDTTFSAQWGLLGFSRKQPKQWRGVAERIYLFNGVDFNGEEANRRIEELPRSGQIAVSSDWDMVQVNFLPEVSHYQKTNRAGKYGILVVLLTFASLFFTEIIKKQRIHIVQYVLIGSAMVLFYSLLLAISEHLGFNTAYFIAAVATTILNVSFVGSITRSKHTAWVFGGVLAICYGFVFVLMQLRDFSLIVGTAGVFVILAVLMYFSTRINWYQFEQSANQIRK